MAACASDLPAANETTPEIAGPRAGSRSGSGSLASSLLVAAAIGGCLFWAHTRAAATLPAYWGAVVFLIVIAQQDTQHRRIPNWATGSGLLLAIAYQVWKAGLGGLLPALAGALVPFVVLLAPYAVRVVGAGDVKAFMVLGGLWGVSVVLSLMVWSVLLAGVMAVVLVAVRGEMLAWLRRWATMLQSPFVGGGLRYIAPQAGEAAAMGLPLGTAIGLAAAAYLMWGGPG